MINSKTIGQCDQQFLAKPKITKQKVKVNMKECYSRNTLYYNWHHYQTPNAYTSGWMHETCRDSHEPWIQPKSSGREVLSLLTDVLPS